MIAYALTFAFGCFGLAMLLTFYRLAKGPSLADRILALDTLVVNSIAVLVLYGIYSDSFAYFEAALLFTMLGFVSTVAYCRFILRGDIIECGRPDGFPGRTAGLRPHRARWHLRRRGLLRPGDRNRVVSAKRVSGRVIGGGRR